jgi:hypothetical protein
MFHPTLKYSAANDEMEQSQTDFSGGAGIVSWEAMRLCRIMIPSQQPLRATPIRLFKM